MSLTLKAHPSQPAPAIAIEADAVRSGDRLELRFMVTGAVGDILVPPLAEPARADELWRRTCFEAFLRPGDGEAYVEINLAPSRQWATYAFDRRREGMREVLDVAPVKIAAAATAEALSLTASIAAPAFAEEPIWRVGLTAVVETTDGGLSYWSLAHPGPVPDFHDPRGCLVELR